MYMKNIFEKVVVFLFIMLMIFLVRHNTIAQRNKIKDFELKNIEVENYVHTTDSRLSNAVITLPDDDKIVGLNNKKGFFFRNG